MLSFSQLLHQMQLTETAAVLASEAALDAQRDIEQDVRDIEQEGSVPPEQRSAAVAAFCKLCLQNYLREGKVEEALQIYEVIVPLHCPAHIEEFSLLFAEDYEPTPKRTAALLRGLLEPRSPTILRCARAVRALRRRACWPGLGRLGVGCGVWGLGSWCVWL